MDATHCCPAWQLLARAIARHAVALARHIPRRRELGKSANRTAILSRRLLVRTTVNKTELNLAPSDARDGFQAAALGGKAIRNRRHKPWRTITPLTSGGPFHAPCKFFSSETLPRSRAFTAKEFLRTSLRGLAAGRHCEKSSEATATISADGIRSAKAPKCIEEDLDHSTGASGCSMPRLGHFLIQSKGVEPFLLAHYNDRTPKL